VPRILTLTTDFGTVDSYVAAVKGTILRLAPGTTLVDVSHEVAPGDVEGAADLLAAAAPAFPAGSCHLAVVDPGVGSERRLLVVLAGEQLFVAPDNGLLTPQLEAGGEAWAVSRRDLFLAGPGATFHGRDRFAPIAAALLRGDHPHALGQPIADAVRLSVVPPSRESHASGTRLRGRVARIDRYGNVVTDIPAAWLLASTGEASSSRASAPALVVTIGEQRAARLVTHYAELTQGEAGVLVGSRGTLELSLRGESLATAWRVERGARVLVELS
jgi:S-adenosylmethionine hydrolase